MTVVVIVEDNLEIAELQALALGPYATTRLVTRDFVSALEPATWDGVNVGVIDLMLPHITGEEILRFMHECCPKVKRVACTSKPMYELSAVRLIADEVLQKPFTVSDFLAAVLGDVPG